MDPFEFDRLQTVVEDEGKGLRPWINRRQFLKWTGFLGANTIFLTTAGRGWGAKAQPGKPVPPFEAWYYTYPEWIEFWRYTPIDLKPLGIQIKPNSGTLITILGRVLRQRKYGDMVTFSWVANPERVDPNFWLKHLLHSKGGRNYVHYANPEFDRIVDAQAAEMDPEKRRELVWKAQEIAAKDHAKMYLAHPDEVHAYNDKDWADASPGLGAALNFANIWQYLNFRPLKDSKVFRCAAIGDIDTLNIFNTSSGTNIQLLRFIYDPFVRYTADFKIIPWAAESWDVVNPTTVDIVLRSGMKFHDGKPVTIADVKFTMDYLKKWNFPFFKFAVNYDRTEVMGDRRLRFHLGKPHAGFVTVDLSFLVILPKHIWQDIPKRAGLADPRKWAVYPETVGTGLVQAQALAEGGRRGDGGQQGAFPSPQGGRIHLSARFHGRGPGGDAGSGGDRHDDGRPGADARGGQSPGPAPQHLHRQIEVLQALVPGAESEAAALQGPGVPPRPGSRHRPKEVHRHRAARRRHPGQGDAHFAGPAALA